VKRFLPILLLVVLIGWQDDHASCVRQHAPRNTIRTFLRDTAEFQQGFSSFDAKQDDSALPVILYGQHYRMTRADLRKWYAIRSQVNAAKLPDTSCDKPFPDTK
jgi:hypothetical protein